MKMGSREWGKKGYASFLVVAFKAMTPVLKVGTQESEVTSQEKNFHSMFVSVVHRESCTILYGAVFRAGNASYLTRKSFIVGWAEKPVLRLEP
ncbi:MAG TPA: hypothetical protein DCP31_05335 [Cyanobacteria bacterium UBA8543]|nr:hypothetical protein [Cyanobacteria bacterium UBA8543]